MAATANLILKIASETKGAESGFDKLGAVASKTMLAIGGAIVATGATGVKAFAEFEKGMAEVFTLLPGISQGAMDKMSDQALALAEDMGILPDEVVPALYQAISAGVPADNVFDFLETSAKASIGGVTDLQTSVDGITSVVNAYGEEVLSATEASDIMFTAVKLGKTDFEQLSRFIFQVVPVASAAGVSFDQVSAALATLTATGTPTRVAATQLRQAIAELGKEGSVAFDIFQQATGQTFPDFVASGGTIEEAFQIMKTAADDMGTGVVNTFGSLEGGMAVATLTSEEGSRKFGVAMEEMATSTGAVNEAFDTMEGTQARTWDKIQAAWSSALIQIGEQMAPFIETVLAWMTESLPGAIDSLIGFFGDLTQAVQDFVTGAGIIIDLFQQLPDLAQLAIVGILGIKTALSVMSAHPVIAGVALVAAGIAAIGAAARENQEFIDAMADRMVDAGGSAEQFTAEILAAEEGTEDLTAILEDGGFTLEEFVSAAANGGDELEAFRGALEVARLEGELSEFQYEILKKGLDNMAQGVRDGTKAWEDNQKALKLEEAALLDAGAAADIAEMEFSLLDQDGSQSIEDFADTVIDKLEEVETSGFDPFIEAVEDTLGESVDLFEGAADEIEITVDEMLQNIAEQIAQEARFTAALETLANAGLDALVTELAKYGPEAAAAAEDLVANMDKATELNAVLTAMGEEGKVAFLLKVSELVTETGISWEEAISEIAANPMKFLADANQVYETVQWTLDTLGALNGTTATVFITTEEEGAGAPPGFDPPAIGDPPALLHGGGTISRAGMAIVGDQGPELVRLGRGAEVLPSGVSTSLLAGMVGGPMGGSPIHVHLQIDSSELAEVIIDPIQQELAKDKLTNIGVHLT